MESPLDAAVLDRLLAATSPFLHAAMRARGCAHAGALVIEAAAAAWPQRNLSLAEIIMLGIPAFRSLALPFVEDGDFAPAAELQRLLAYERPMQPPAVLAVFVSALRSQQALLVASVCDPLGIDLGSRDWVGFDVDHTLVSYRTASFNRAMLSAAARQLIEQGARVARVYAAYSDDNNAEFVAVINRDKVPGCLAESAELVDDDHPNADIACKGVSGLTRVERKSQYKALLIASLLADSSLDATSSTGDEGAVSGASTSTASAGAALDPGPLIALHDAPEALAAAAAAVPYLAQYAGVGVVVDLRLGNVLWLDGQGHVTYALHGDTPLDAEMLRATYEGADLPTLNGYCDLPLDRADRQVASNDFYRTTRDLAAAAPCNEAVPFPSTHVLDVEDLHAAPAHQPAANLVVQDGSPSALAAESQAYSGAVQSRQQLTARLSSRFGAPIPLGMLGAAVANRVDNNGNAVLPPRFGTTMSGFDELLPPLFALLVRRYDSWMRRRGVAPAARVPCNTMSPDALETARYGGALLGSERTPSDVVGAFAHNRICRIAFSEIGMHCVASVSGDVGARHMKRQPGLANSDRKCSTNSDNIVSDPLTSNLNHASPGTSDKCAANCLSDAAVRNVRKDAVDADAVAAVVCSVDAISACASGTDSLNRSLNPALWVRQPLSLPRQAATSIPPHEAATANTNGADVCGNTMATGDSPTDYSFLFLAIEHATRVVYSGADVCSYGFDAMMSGRDKKGLDEYVARHPHVRSLLVSLRRIPLPLITTDAGVNGVRPSEACDSSNARADRTAMDAEHMPPDVGHDIPGVSTTHAVNDSSTDIAAQTNGSSLREGTACASRVMQCETERSIEPVQQRGASDDGASTQNIHSHSVRGVQTRRLRTFILSNASYEHVDTVMRHAYGADWLEACFDAVFVDARKRRMFARTGSTHNDIPVALDARTGLPLPEAVVSSQYNDSPTQGPPLCGQSKCVGFVMDLSRSRVWRGARLADVQATLAAWSFSRIDPYATQVAPSHYPAVMHSVQAAKVLYVGDHPLQDVVGPTTVANWQTVAVLPALEALGALTSAHLERGSSSDYHLRIQRTKKMHLDLCGLRCVGSEPDWSRPSLLLAVLRRHAKLIVPSLDWLAYAMLPCVREAVAITERAACSRATVAAFSAPGADYMISTTPCCITDIHALQRCNSDDCSMLAPLPNTVWLKSVHCLNARPTSLSARCDAQRTHRHSVRAACGSNCSEVSSEQTAMPSILPAATAVGGDSPRVQTTRTSISSRSAVSSGILASIRDKISYLLGAAAPDTDAQSRALVEAAASIWISPAIVSSALALPGPAALLRCAVGVDSHKFTEATVIDISRAFWRGMLMPKRVTATAVCPRTGDDLLPQAIPRTGRGKDVTDGRVVANSHDEQWRVLWPDFGDRIQDLQLPPRQIAPLSQEVSGAARDVVLDEGTSSADALTVGVAPAYTRCAAMCGTASRALMCVCPLVS